jgi:hypothetical protein
MHTPIPYNCRIEAKRGEVTIICNESGLALMTMTPTETTQLVAELRGIEHAPDELVETCDRLEAAAQSAARQVCAVKGAFWLHEALVHACEMVLHDSIRDQR